MEIDGIYLVDVSGQSVIADISGQSVVTSISGQSVIADISGQSVIANISGQSITVDISGQSVVTSISGQTVDISGQTVIIDISGQSVVTSISGQSVDISGQSVVTSISGQSVDISGQVFRRVPHTSTTTILPGSGNFSGSIVNSIGYAIIHGSVFSNKSGGLRVRQSPDGTNWDAVNNINVAANVGRRWRIEIDAPYTLLTYENGTTAQSSFRLYAWLTT